MKKADIGVALYLLSAACICPIPRIHWYIPQTF